ncbi:hypothetical protein EV132_117132 [Rhizobium sullae]|uniref:Uncharacterized protein n=1 Tax=Rhizobium sullae TaxID=50338 RepID=A0A4R3PZW6_RHISU|nr:hypothetical protein EV132_117132 [Rhizobium sullae]
MAIALLAEGGYATGMDLVAPNVWSESRKVCQSSGAGCGAARRKTPRSSAASVGQARLEAMEG